MGAGLQESLLDKMPHQDRCQGHKSKTEQKVHGRRQSPMAQHDNRLNNRPVNDIYAIRKVAKSREVAEIAPKPKNEYHARNPENIKDLFGDEVIGKIQHRGDAGDDSKMRLQLIKVEQQQDARCEISKLRGKLNLHFRIDAARVFRHIGTYGARRCRRLLPWSSGLRSGC